MFFSCALNVRRLFLSQVIGERDMNVTIERPENGYTKLDMPLAKQRAPANIGIHFQPQQQTLKRPFGARNPMSQQQQQQPPAPPPLPSREVVQTLNDFANPTKLRAGSGPPRSDASYDYDDDEDNEDDGEDEDVGARGGGEDAEDIAGDFPAGADEDDELDDPLKPSEGFRTFEEEKADILCKLTRLKRQGLPGLRNFGIHSDIREMRAELNRVRTELDLEASIKWQRKILMACVSTMEFTNRKWNPFDLQLNGWSEQVMESVTDYDRCFERLFFKYRSKVSMPPEAELLLMVGSSAFMFHLTQTMFKSQSAQDPNFLQNIQKAAQAMAQQAQQSQQAQQQAQQQQPEQQSSQNDDGRREIRGPPMDFSAFLGGGGPGNGLPGMMMPPPQPSRPAPQFQSQQQTQRPAKKRPLSVTSSEDDDDDDARLSDIISEDLVSVPDDLSSLSGGEEEKIKTVTIATTKGRPRKRAATKGSSTKKVMLI